MRSHSVLAVLCVGLAAATAAAKDTPFSVALDDAKILARKGENLKAAERYGEAVALAQAASDLAAEETAADSLSDWFDGLRPDPAQPVPDPAAPKGTTADTGSPGPTGPTRAALLAAVMTKLDANRCGAFVSAPVLARNVLRLETETGDFSSVADAASVAAAHAVKPSSGRAAAIVGKYAAGLRAVAEGKFDTAAALLDEAAADAGKLNFLDLEAHAATEAACAWIRAGKPDSAAASMAASVVAFGQAPDRWKVDCWQHYADVRLAAAPDVVKKPLADFAAQFEGGRSASGAGGAGGAGGGSANGGSRAKPRSAVAKILDTLGAGKAFVSVLCKHDGMEMQWTTSAKHPLTPFDHGTRVANDGGVTLFVHDRSVALRMVDLRGLTGQPGDSGGGAEPTAVRAFYLLAEGETWSVSKEGVVSISK